MRVSMVVDVGMHGLCVCTRGVSVGIDGVDNGQRSVFDFNSNQTHGNMTQNIVNVSLPLTPNPTVAGITNLHHIFQRGIFFAQCPHLLRRKRVGVNCIPTLTFSLDPSLTIMLRLNLKSSLASITTSLTLTLNLTPTHIFGAKSARDMDGQHPVIHHNPCTSEMSDSCPSVWLTGTDSISASRTWADGDQVKVTSIRTLRSIQPSPSNSHSSSHQTG